MAQKPMASASPEKSETITMTNTTSPEAHETPETRAAAATKLVDRFALWSGVGGLIPVPYVDILAVGGIQLAMLRRLSQIYGVAFTENTGKALLASLAGTMIPVTSGMGATSMLKAVPIVGTLTSAFFMPALSAGATYAIGKVFIQHFESGGTLLDFNPPDYREFIKAQKQRWDSRSTGAVSDARSTEASRSSSSGSAASS